MTDSAVLRARQNVEKGKTPAVPVRVVLPVYVLQGDDAPLRLQRIVQEAQKVRLVPLRGKKILEKRVIQGVGTANTGIELRVRRRPPAS